MAKSIRSKIKRKHRAEFRRTIGDEAYQANAKKVQEKLKISLEQQTMKSLDRLSDALDTQNDSMVDDNADTTIYASETSNIAETKGENRVLVSKRSKKKMKHSYKMKAIERKQKEEARITSKPRPRYHCAF